MNGLFDETDTDAPAAGPANRNTRRPAQRSFVRKTPRVTRAEPPTSGSADDLRTRWYLESAEVCWYEHSRHLIPTTPFHLHRWSRISDVPGLLAALDRNIAAGPESPNARQTLSDLARLRELFGSRPPPG